MPARIQIMAAVGTYLQVSSFWDVAQIEVTSELRTLFVKHVVVNHLSCRAIHGMHRLGRNPEEGLAIYKPVECPSNISA